MDSGSADFWVGSETCTDCVSAVNARSSIDLLTLHNSQGDHILLGTESSTSFVDSGRPFAVQYGTGNVSGSVVQDDVTISGLTLTGHTFGVATSESQEFSSNRIPSDGLMGLAQSVRRSFLSNRTCKISLLYQTISEQRTLTPVEALAETKAISDAIVSYKLARVADNKNDGEITFG